jgi:hypothetical protein
VPVQSSAWRSEARRRRCGGSIVVGCHPDEIKNGSGGTPLALADMFKALKSAQPDALMTHARTTCTTTIAWPRSHMEYLP